MKTSLVIKVVYRFLGCDPAAALLEPVNQRLDHIALLVSPWRT